MAPASVAAVPEESSAGALCLETQSRQIMAVLVNDVVADALRLGLHDSPGERVSKINGAKQLGPADKESHG